MSQHQKPDNAPGCFGSPLCHSANRNPCNVCPFKAACGPAAADRADRLSKLYRIEELLKHQAKARPTLRVVKQAPSPSPRLHITDRFRAALGTRGVETLNLWISRGIDLKAAVEKGQNPFTGTTSFMRPMLDALQAGGFTRDEAKALLVREMGWTETQAATHAGFGIPILILTGAATFKDGRVVPFKQKEMAA